MSDQPKWDFNPREDSMWKFIGHVDGVDIWMMDYGVNGLSVYLRNGPGAYEATLYQNRPIHPQWGDAVIMACRLAGYEA